jgi:hypothetical protein
VGRPRQTQSVPFPRLAGHLRAILAPAGQAGRRATAAILVFPVTARIRFRPAAFPAAQIRFRPAAFPARVIPVRRVVFRATAPIPAGWAVCRVMVRIRFRLAASPVAPAAPVAAVVSAIRSAAVVSAAPVVSAIQPAAVVSAIPLAPAAAALAVRARSVTTSSAIRPATARLSAPME